MKATTQTPASCRVLYLEAFREAGQVRISAAVRQAGEIQTARHVEESSVCLEKIDRRCIGMVEVINQASRNGRLTSELLEKLKDTGQVFRDELFSAKIKEQLNSTATDQLILTIDDQLAQIPWELLHDGHTFLCQQFAMGRVVRTRHSVSTADVRPLNTPLQMLVLADPQADLKAAYDEGLCLRDFADVHADKLRVDFHSQNVTSDWLRARMRRFDMVHFAGHAGYYTDGPESNGWRLSQGILGADDVLRMAGTGVMPSLVFANACQSARSEGWTLQPGCQEGFYGLANAFIRAGVKHYLGTYWEILDEPSRHFALAFYQHLVAGLTVGAAVRAARQNLIEQFGEQCIVWVSYLLYGDPTIVYIQRPAEMTPDAGMAAGTQSCLLAQMTNSIRSPEEVIRFGKEPARRSKKHWWVGLAAIFLAALVFVGFIIRYFGNHRDDQQALEAFQAGDLNKVESICIEAKDRHSKNGSCSLLLGHVSFFKGDLRSARSHYEDAVKANRSQQEKTEALIGLGRIASERAQSEKALGYYQQATAMTPENERPYIAQALLLDRCGAASEALRLLSKASAISSDPATLSALVAQINSRADLKADVQSRERLDRVIKELEARVPTAGYPKSHETWSSMPLTIALLDLENVGYSLQEGLTVLLESNLVDILVRQQRFQVVDRNMLEALAAELKLASSSISDPQNVLHLGRLVAARVVLAGRVVNAGTQSQASLRAIETETGRILTVANTTFNSDTAASIVAARIANDLIHNIYSHFPLRAKVVQCRDSELILDIGRRQGAVEGLLLRTAKGDLTVKVISAQDSRCNAIMQSDAIPPRPGLRLQAIPGQGLVPKNQTER
jgi:CHAT domain-containing protein